MTFQMAAAHAVQIGGYGPPEVLVWAEVELAPPALHEVRLRTLAAAVNHTDLEIRAGHWPVRTANPFPYVPGVEVVGVIEEIGPAVPPEMRGQTAITMMQGLGGVRAERSGGYAEFVTVAADTVALLPPGIDPLAIASLGLVGVTAFHGLRRIGALAGKRLLVTGAAGGIGSAATALAHADGAMVIGLVSRPDQVDYVRGLGADDVIVASRHERPALAPDSVDGVLDAVGGHVFGPCVNALRAGGVLSLVGAVGGGDVAFDAWQLIRPVTLTGYSTEDLTGDALREAIAVLADGIMRRAIPVPGHQLIPLADASRAHRLLEQGGVTGRVLLVPSGPVTV